MINSLQYLKFKYLLYLSTVIIRSMVQVYVPVIHIELRISILS